MNNKIAAIILAAGKGTRMKSDLPKVMMPICGKPMIHRILDTLEELKVGEIIAVTAPDGDVVRKEIFPHKSVIQEKQLGTGHAVLCAREFIGKDDFAVLNGDDVICTEGDSALKQLCDCFEKYGKYSNPPNAN